jgi:hypothetical protein
LVASVDASRPQLSEPRRDLVEALRACFVACLRKEGDPLGDVVVDIFAVHALDRECVGPSFLILRHLRIFPNHQQQARASSKREQGHALHTSLEARVRQRIGVPVER